MAAPTKVIWQCDPEQLEVRNSLNRTVIRCCNGCYNWLIWSGEINDHFFSLRCIYVLMIIGRPFDILSTEVCIWLLAILSITSITVTSLMTLNAGSVVCRSLIWIRKMYEPSHVHSAIQCCPIRIDNVNFHTLATKKMSASIEWWTVARQAWPSCLTIFGDQHDQTL